MRGGRRGGEHGHEGGSRDGASDQRAPSAVTVKVQPQSGQPTCSLLPAGSAPFAMRCTRVWRVAAISAA